MPNDLWVWRSGTIAQQVLLDLQRASLMPIPEGARWLRCDNPSVQVYGVALVFNGGVASWRDSSHFWELIRLKEAGLVELFQRDYLVRWLNQALVPEDIPLMPLIWRSALQVFDTPYSRTLLGMPPWPEHALPICQYQTDDL